MHRHCNIYTTMTSAVCLEVLAMALKGEKSSKDASTFFSNKKFAITCTESAHHLSQGLTGG